MQPHERRVIDEKRELDAKHGNLARFIGGNVYPTLDETDRGLLITQLDLMKSYSDVLTRRIERFGI